MYWDKHHYCIFLQDTEITVLREGVRDANDTASVWMSDTPQEYFTNWDLVVRAESGSVLVGGLGLGLLVHLLSLRRDITEIVVVEKSKEIIQMVKPYLPKEPKIEVIQGNFFGVVQELSFRRTFDNIICDIWKGNTEGRETFEACRNLLEDNFMNSQHLFWGFQSEQENEQALVFGHLVKRRSRK